MKRCFHAHAKLYEEMNDTAVFNFVNGEMIDSYRCDGTPTGKFFVCCEDCGYERKFRQGKQAPKWVSDMIAKVTQ